MKSNHYQVGIVADDITGSNDIGIMYSHNGHKVNIFPYTSFNADKFDGDVVIIDTDSRFATIQDSYTRVYEATKKLIDLGVKQFFKKTCSVFRGNIGTEFDAMLDALGENFAIIVLGFPDNGRTTVNSLHYVHGTLLEKSEFKNDPMNPMTESNLVDILQKQTKRKVGSVHFDIVEQGSAAIKEDLDRLVQKYNYVIIDVRNNTDLHQIAEAIKDIKVVCGASAIGKEFGAYLVPSSSNALKMPPRLPGIGIFSISGSITPQTKAQIKYAKIHGTYVIEVDIGRLLMKNQSDLMEQVAMESIKQLQNGINVLVYAANSPECIKNTKNLGMAIGMNEAEVAKFVSTSLSKICRRVMKTTNQNRVLVAGGDTSGSFCSTFGITGMTVYKEISPGLPSCISLSKPPLLMILKSGSFGNESFFIDAYEHLKRN